MNSSMRRGVHLIVNIGVLLLGIAGCTALDAADETPLGTVQDGLTASGQWVDCSGPGTGIARFPGGYPTNCAVLTDGHILCSGSDSANWRRWFLLEANGSDGSYVCGSWFQVGMSSYGRIFNPSFVLRDGNYLTCGGEFTGDSANNPDPDKGECEVFDSHIGRHSWAASSSMPTQVNDTPGTMLADGRIIMKEYDTQHTYLFNPDTSSWNQAADIDVFFRSEGGSLLLPDGSVLGGWRRFTRYLPAADRWLATAATPGVTDGEFVSSPTDIEEEIGAMVLLQDGRALVLGGNAHNGLYTPPAVSSGAGSWALARDTPVGADPAHPLNHGDTCASVEPTTGNVFTIATNDQDGSAVGPSTFLEYQVASDSWATIPPPPVGMPNVDGNRIRLLPLPTGDIMVTGYTNGTIAVWRPTPSINDSWRPTLTSIAPAIFHKVRVEGTQLNGLTTGADMGDDAKMASNYPLVVLQERFSVTYARTRDFDQMAPRSGTPGYFFFDVPGDGSAHNYDLHISAAGLDSVNHVMFHTPALDVGPALLSTWSL